MSAAHRQRRITIRPDPGSARFDDRTIPSVPERTARYSLPFADGKHPNQERYPGQRIFVVNIDGYAYLVPFVEGETELFLKTVIPSRKATDTYLRRERENG